MKYTEEAFRNWVYEVAAEESPGRLVPESEAGDAGAPGSVVKDRIAQSMFQQLLLAPKGSDDLATTNLNGDSLSDALAARVGDQGMAPGPNVGDRLALFEAKHGTAPELAGKDAANPWSLILSGAMVLEHLSRAGRHHRQAGHSRSGRLHGRR